MNANLFFMLFLGLALIVAPSAVGYRYLKQWLSENNRLERRMRDVEKSVRYY